MSEARVKLKARVRDVSVPVELTRDEIASLVYGNTLDIENLARECVDGGEEHAQHRVHTMITALGRIQKKSQRSIELLETLLDREAAMEAQS